MSRNVLTPEALAMVDTIARTGSFAAAARELGKVPSALTYNVRQLEEALDVLLFDRRSRQARLTAAGHELLQEGRRLLAQMDAVANRVKRVATGWETQLTLAVDGIISRVTLFELCEAFFALRPALPMPTDVVAEPRRSGPGTRLRLRTEVLAGTWEALVSGQADLAIGVGLGNDQAPSGGVQLQPLGDVDFVFAVAPHHPLAAAEVPISDAELMRHRAVAVADSAQRLAPLTVNLLPGQEVFTVSSIQAKLEAQLRCMGCGWLPEPVARDHIGTGRLVVKATERAQPTIRIGYAWRIAGLPAGAASPRSSAVGVPAATAMAVSQRPQVGLALRWWLDALENPTTRHALLHRHGLPLAADGD